MFENKPELFPIEKNVVEWMFPVFKPEEPFRYFIPKQIGIQKNTTFKDYFDFFQNPPTQVFNLPANDSIGCAINER